MQTLQIEIPVEAAVAALLKKLSQAQTPGTMQSPPPAGQYWPEQGGVYAGIVRGEDGQADHYLIVSTSPAGYCESVTWGGYETNEPGARHERDGLANTVSLCDSDTDHPAAQWAAALEIDGHSDWYLPARRELRLLWINVPELFAEGWYWSSTQFSPDDAWGQVFDGGSQSYGHKCGFGRARAVRRLSVI